jgi:hypothetical protein
VGALDDLRQDVDRAIRLNGDLEFYAAEYLRIRPKAGSLAPFLFNPAQRELHRRVEEQKAKTGRVRVVVLKARQMGISTYVAARYYKATTSNPGLRTAIIGHEKPASKNLFNLVKRFHDHMPEDQRQSTGNKIAQLGSLDYFKREYPLTPDEAFMASKFDSFITSDLVMQARKEEIEPYGPLLIGVDPAGKGADSTAIAWRRGHCITKIEKRHGLDTMEVAGLVAKIIREEKPVKVNIDVGGLGVGVADRLEEQGYGEVINRVNFGGKPVEPPALDETGKPAGGPANRRAEMWSNLKTALQGRFSLPDSDTLHADLTSVGYKYMSDGKLLLEAIVRNPNPSNPGDQGQVTTGYYTLVDGILTMTNSEGIPVRGLNGGDKVTHKIEAGEDPRAVAGRLTLKIYRMLRGEGAGAVAGFNRPLGYPVSGVA